MGGGLTRDSGIRVAQCNIDSAKLSHFRHASQKTTLIAELRDLERRQAGFDPLSDACYQAVRRYLIGQMRATLKRTPDDGTTPGFPSEADSRAALNLSHGACVEAAATVCEVSGGSGSESNSVSSWAPLPIHGRRAPLTAHVVPSAEAIPSGLLPPRIFCTGVEWGFQCKLGARGGWFERLRVLRECSGWRVGSCQSKRMGRELVHRADDAFRRRSLVRVPLPFAPRPNEIQHP